MIRQQDYLVHCLIIAQEPRRRLRLKTARLPCTNFVVSADSKLKLSFVPDVGPAFRSSMNLSPFLQATSVTSTLWDAYLGRIQKVLLHIAVQQELSS